MEICLEKKKNRKKYNRETYSIENPNCNKKITFENQINYPSIHTSVCAHDSRKIE